MSDFFGQTMRDMASIPEGHLMGIDEHGRIIDRGPAPEGADDTWGGPCLAGYHDDCVGVRRIKGHPDVFCGCPHHAGETG